MAQSSSGATGAGASPTTSDPSETKIRTPSRSGSISTPVSTSTSASKSRSLAPHTSLSGSGASTTLGPATALGPTSNCVEYERLVGKIMRDNFWDLDPFTVGLNPGLLNFDKPFIRSKAPHIKGKMRLLDRILGRMVDDEHLLLVCTEPNMYRPHPNRSTIDYLVIGDDPPWIPHFFNGSLAYPHVEEAMNSITRFLNSESGSKPPSRVPTVGVSRASSFAINRFKTEELPSCEEYIDFVHAVVQSISRPGSTGTIREDHFFPSMAVTPVAEVRKRATLVMRLMARMVEDDVLTRVSAEEGTYVLHPDCRPTDYMADRGLTDISHWVWTFKTWAVLDQVAEKAVMNLEKFLKDLSPAERSRIKVEREDSPPPSKLESKFETTRDDDVVIVKQEEAASSFTKNRTPKPQPKPKRQKHKRTDRAVSSSSSGSDQSAIIPILTFPKSPPPRKISTPPQLEPEDSLMPSIEIPDENSAFAIQRRERQTFKDYFQTTQPENQQLATLSPLEFDKLHISYPNDSFEVIIEKTVLGHIFQIICHDCDRRRVATKFQGSIAKLQIHLNAESHVSNVMSKLDRMGEMPIETVETKKRMEVLQRVANQRGYDHNKYSRPSSFVSQSVVKHLPASSNSRHSPSPGSMEVLQAMYELPQRAFKYQPRKSRTEDCFADRSSVSAHEPTPPVQQGPSRPMLLSPSPAQAPDESFRRQISKRFEILEESNWKKKVKLDHFGTLLGQTNNKYGEIEKEVSSLKSREDQHTADVQSIRDSLRDSLDPLLQALQRSQAVPREVAEQLEGLLGRDEQHESRWQQLEHFRGNILTRLKTLGEKQNQLEERLVGLQTRRHSQEASADMTNIDARIQELESSKIQLLEAQNELEQEHRVMNARFGLLEQDDNCLDKATRLITGFSSRIETLEASRSKVLAANESLVQNLKKLSDRVEVAEQDSLSTTSLLESVRESIVPINKSIDLLSERYAAQDKHIEMLTKKYKKLDEWVKYFSDVSNIQKGCIEDLQSRQVSEAKSRRLFEERMEEMLRGSKEREEKLAERIKSLEKKEERSAMQLALLKTYATPRSVAGSDNERGGMSTPKSSSQTAAASTTSRASQLAASGTTTPIRPPSHKATASTTSKASQSAASGNPAPIRPPSQTGAAAAPIRPPSSQTSANASKNTPTGAPPKSSQPHVPTRKPRKF